MATSTTAELLIHLDPDTGDTLQYQICAGVRTAILSGRVKPGARLPSSRALAADLGISRTTSLLAIEQLMAEGYVTARPGSGIFVASDLPDDMSRPLPIRPVHRRHPPLSCRASMLAELKPRAWRLPGGPRPFRAGTPAVDLLPIGLWSRLCARRLVAASASHFDYGDWPPLREAIAAYLQRARATRCNADQVVIVAGAQGGLDLVARLLLDPGDSAWIEEPGHVGTRAALIGAGAHVVSVPVDDDGLIVEAGVRRAHEARLACVTPSHQFPLGVVMSLARRLTLLKWASAAGSWIVEDDYDSAFRYGARPVPSLHGLDDDGRVIYLASFSKTLFPSLRLGFLVVPPDLRDRFVAARRALDFQPPSLNQAVLADFIAEGHYERHLRRMRTVYQERLEATVEAARRYCGGALRVRPVLTGLHAVADLDGVDAERVSREAMARGVEAMPLSLYFDRVQAPNALLLGFGPVRAEDAVDGMRRLAAAIESARSGSAFAGSGGTITA